MNGIEIADRLFGIHKHLSGYLKSDIDEEAQLHDPYKIVYEEEDIIQLLKDLGHPEPNWEGNAEKYK